MDESDHRVIGNRLDLFHQQEEAPGMAFWHPRGYALYAVVEGYIRKRMREADYREVRTPLLLARSLWEASGHWERFGAQMFSLVDGERDFALKPMSCPAHVQIFNGRVRSFRELPLRLAEFGACHRNEPSGALLGLLRGRAFVQDDAHVFCTEAQIAGEVVRFCALLRRVYADFGFDEIRVGFSTRPAERAGDEGLWDRAEALLAEAARDAGLDLIKQPGEGAFYGPKLEFALRDDRGRLWQCGTIQLDLVLPDRLGAAYVDAENRHLRPAILHHAVLGSIERFIGLLLEHYEGRLPLWLAPEQLALCTIGEGQEPYAERVASLLSSEGYRVALDLRPERLSRKILDARAQEIPLLLALGRREAATETVSLRRRDGDRESLPLAAVADALRAEAFR
ncbi:MAG TPA: threonine--tRNA ligase [Stellaceae bacterium]|nr:threonine--tRNA ligase [Stellaceae bacterium]